MKPLFEALFPVCFLFVNARLKRPFRLGKVLLGEEDVPAAVPLCRFERVFPWWAPGSFEWVFPLRTFSGLVMYPRRMFL